MATASPSPAKPSYIPEILEEHYEELQFLWGIRTSALRSPRFTAPKLAKFEERIEAHVQGMLVVGESMRDLVEPGLAEADPTFAFVAAFALLRLNRPATTRLVLDQFAIAKGAALDGIREALCHAAPPETFRELDFLAGGDIVSVAVSALEVLMWRSKAAPLPARILPFLAADDPSARRSAWRMLSNLGIAADPKAYSAAMRDDDVLAKREAVWSAVWARVPGILALARTSAANPHPAQSDLHRVLAIVGTPEDRARIDHLSHNAALGAPAVRFALIGAFGHPSHVEVLIERMGDADPEIAVAAGQAFTRLTGVDVSSDQMGKLPPANPTGDAALDEEFAEEAPLPDPARARSAWSELAPQLAGADKICRGLDVSTGASADQLSTFDLASRWDMAARNRFYGISGPSPIDLTRFPQLR